MEISNTVPRLLSSAQSFQKRINRQETKGYWRDQCLMFRSLSQRVGRNVFSTTKRNMGASPLSGDATSPHYADFGHGANQMLPFIELQKNPIPYKWTPRARVPTMVSGHHPELHQHQVFTQATGHDFSIVAGPDLRMMAQRREAVVSRVKGTAGYVFLFSLLGAYEVWMWDGLQFLQQEIWDELALSNLKMNAHGLQWEKSWREIQRDTSIAELYEIMQNRPYYTNNPYYFSQKDLDIADKNISYRAIEPVLQSIDADLYRKQTNYIIFYSQLSEQLSNVTSPKNLEAELTEWLYNQTKFTVDELNEILAFAPQWNDDFAFHRRAVYDEASNQIVFFEGTHRATVEEAQKAEVPSIKESEQTSFAAAQLLAQLIKGGPVQEFKTALYVNNENPEDIAALEAVLGFIAADVDKAQSEKLQKVAQQVLSSSDNSLSTFKANAAGLGLPVPTDFTIGAINYAVAAKNNAV